MKVINILCCLILIGLLGSCKNDFDLVEEGQDIPIVYGFINIGVDSQLIRVERSFAGENINAFQAAQNEDSVYYDDASISIINEATGVEHELERVDATLFGIERDEGDFLLEPNIAYYVPTDQLAFRGGEEVTLVIDRGNEKPAVTSTTTVLTPVDLTDPVPDKPIHFTYRNKAFFFSKEKEVGVLGLTMFMYIREIDIDDPSQQEIIKVTWRMISGLDVDKTSDFEIPRVEGRQFYTTLANNLDPEKKVFRQFSHFDLFVQGGGDEISEFRRIARANSGLTGAQELPLYTNIDGGIGIFSSKYSRLYEGFTVSGETRDSLQVSQILEGYNFVD